MKCTKCGLREATTEVIQRHNGIIEKMYLCDECAKDYRPEMGFDDFDVLNKLINGSPMGLLTGLNTIFDAPQDRTLICPDCKTTSEEFLKSGFVGCPRCYEVFEPLISRTVKKLQQSERHIGKRPVSYSADIDAAKLKQELQDAIDRGDYARAGAISVELDKLGKLGNGED